MVCIRPSRVSKRGRLRRGRGNAVHIPVGIRRQHRLLAKRANDLGRVATGIPFDGRHIAVRIGDGRQASFAVLRKGADRCSDRKSVV